MRELAWRRLGAILAAVVVLSVVLVPAASASSPAAGMPVTAPAPAIDVAHSDAASQLAVGPVYYTVRRGDTLLKIARRYGTTVAALMQLNGIANPNRIYVGQVLLIRRGTTPPPPPPSGGTWLADYYNTQDLSGSPVLERRDANIDFNWGWSSPSPVVFPDHFSARWTRTFYMTAGTYRLTARVDDGIRVWIDGTLVLDQWEVQPVTTYQQDYILTSTGYHTWKVEYFENTGLAEAHVTSQKLN
jgi:LysM repeat protein